MPKEKSADMQKQIDEIDLKLYNLLIHRTELDERQPVNAVENTLGKEAAAIKNLLKFHRGNFPRYVIAKIWREILSASACLREKLKFSVFETDSCDDLINIVQEHFGSYAEYVTRSSFGQVMTVITNHEAQLGIIPCDNHEMNLKPWWSGFSSTGEGLKIIAKLPFLKRKENPLTESDVYVVALTHPAQSGDDVSLLGIEVNNDVSVSTIVEALESAGYRNPKIQLMAKVDDENKSYLAEVDGFLKPNDDGLKPLRAQFNNINIVGSYARPIEL